MQSSTLHIGRFNLSDVESVLAIEQASFGTDAYSEADLHHWLRWRCDWFFVARNDQGVIGYIVGAIENKQGIIISLAVNPGSRQSGVASALIHDLREQLMEMGASHINLHVRTTNEAAINLYTKLGFKIQEMTLNYYKDEATAFQMTLTFES